MPDPVLHVLAGPNGAGKTTFHEQVLGPATHLAFVNADRIASECWPGHEVEHAYDAARLAARERARRIAARRSFVTETVFSHPSKVALLEGATEAGYIVVLHVVLVPEDLAVARVLERVTHGGHHVPEEKVRSRFRRLWGHVAEALPLVDEARVYDNSRAAAPFRLVAICRRGRLVGTATWPAWAPPELAAAVG